MTSPDDKEKQMPSFHVSPVLIFYIVVIALVILYINFGSEPTYEENKINYSNKGDQGNSKYGQ